MGGEVSFSSSRSITTGMVNKETIKRHQKHAHHQLCLLVSVTRCDFPFLRTPEEAFRFIAGGVALAV